MSASVFVLVLLAFAVGFVCCFLVWQSADRQAVLLREQRELLLLKVASRTIVDDLIAGQTEQELATYYGLPVAEIAELRRAGGLDSSHQWLNAEPDHVTSEAEFLAGLVSADNELQRIKAAG